MAYLRQKRGIILTLIFFFLICAVLFYLYHVPLDCLIYTGIICLIIGSIAVITDFSRFCRSRRKLQDAMQTITVSLETLPLARTPLEHDYQQLLEILHTEQNRILDETAKLSLEMSSLTATVLTDEKWAQFIVEQILSNSLKYTRTGSIRIWQKDPAALVIEDTGIGIDPADIPRLGERGFTGYNGRLDKKSTGIGLYLCKEISRRLSHTLTIESEPGKGTRVTIDFATRQLQAE